MSQQQMNDAFEAVLMELQDYDLASVADAAEISCQTLHNWIDGTYKPHYNTLIKVARVLDFEVIVTVRK